MRYIASSVTQFNHDGGKKSTVILSGTMPVKRIHTAEKHVDDIYSGKCCPTRENNKQERELKRAVLNIRVINSICAREKERKREINVKETLCNYII